jgi:hypothetical protein
MSIDTINNKSICPFPWVHSYIGARYGKKLCCVSKNLEGLKKISDKEFWNCQKMKDIRLRMLNGEKISECETCYRDEENGIESLRQNSSKAYSLMYDNLDDVTNDDGSTNEYIKYFDYRTIYCNLQCISCGYIFSTKHISLYKKMAPHFPPLEVKIDKKFEQKMENDMIESLNNQHCTDIYWAGGEPMISKIHWGVIQKIQELREDPNTIEYANSIKMHYNTNLTKLYWNKQLIPKILKPNKPFIMASLDGVNETIEYTRDGLKWDEVKKNWEIYYSYLPDTMGISPILSSPVLLDFDRFFNFFNAYKCACFMHNFQGNVENHKKIKDLLNIRFFPKYIINRVVDNAIQKLKNSNFNFFNDPIDILTFYKNNPIELSKEKLGMIKTKVLYRDKYLITKRSFGDLLKIIDEEASEWYESIEPIVIDEE